MTMSTTATTTTTASSASTSASAPASAASALPTTSSLSGSVGGGLGGGLGGGGGGPGGSGSPASLNLSSPRTPCALITTWTAEDSAEFLASLGLGRYCESFLDNDIVGEALVALHHEELRELGITSAGHRLTILKRVYEIKRKQGVAFTKDHYVPLTAEEDHDPVTRTEMTHLVQSLRQRDVRIRSVELELRRLADDYRRMREEFLPVVKMAKDKSQPLPFQPGSAPAGAAIGHGPGGLGGSSFGDGSTLTPDYNPASNVASSVSDALSTPPTASLGSTLAPEKPSAGSSLSRTLSKKFFSSSKHSPSPTPAPSMNHDRSTTPNSLRGGGLHDHADQDGPATLSGMSAVNPTGSSSSNAANINLNSHSSPKMGSSMQYLSNRQQSPTSPGFFNTCPRARTPLGDAYASTPDSGYYAHSHPHTYSNIHSHTNAHSYAMAAQQAPPTTTVTPPAGSASASLRHCPSVRRGPGMPPTGGTGGGGGGGGGPMAVSPSLSSVSSPHHNSSGNAYHDGGSHGGSGGGSGGGGGGASGIEATKSFRVTMDDPCYKVLPAALKKYNINEDWRLYALYIVCGDHERCLELDEKPLILFKQLDREGKKPVFMLRRKAQLTPGHEYGSGAGGLLGNSGGGGGGGSGGTTPGRNVGGGVGPPPGSSHGIADHQQHQHHHAHQSHFQHQHQNHGHQHAMNIPGGCI